MAVDVDIFLTIVAPIAVIIFWVIGFFFLVYYQHPDDTGNSRLPKLIIVRIEFQFFPSNFLDFVNLCSFM